MSAYDIFEYNVHDALADGTYIDASTGDLAEVSRQHYKYPVYMTSGVFHLIDKAVKNKRHMNDRKGVWHDILWMSRTYKRNLSPSQVVFMVTITGAARKRNFHMLATVQPHGSQDPNPCVVISLPEEN